MTFEETPKYVKVSKLGVLLILTSAGLSRHGRRSASAASMDMEDYEDRRIDYSKFRPFEMMTDHKSHKI